MTTTALGGSATARDLLFGISRTNSTEALTGSLRSNGTVAAHVRCPVGLNAVVEHELATKTDELLSANLADVAITGWKRYDALRQAAQRTHAAPTTEEIVALAAHTVESSHRTAIEVFIDGASVAIINVELKIAVTIDCALAVVRQGWLTGLRTGTFTVELPWRSSRTSSQNGIGRSTCPGPSCCDMVCLCCRPSRALHRSRRGRRKRLGHVGSRPTMAFSW